MKKTRLAGALTVCWLCVIWGNSLLPGDSSSQVSGLVGQILEKILPFLNMEGENAMVILRKMGHLSEFAVLGALLGWLGALLEKGRLRPVLWGIAAAAADETIQLFVPDRHGCVTDVLIDTAGVVTGVVLLLICRKIYKTRCR